MLGHHSEKLKQKSDLHTVSGSLGPAWDLASIRLAPPDNTKIQSPAQQHSGIPTQVPVSLSPLQETQQRPWYENLISTKAALIFAVGYAAWVAKRLYSRSQFEKGIQLYQIVPQINYTVRTSPEGAATERRSLRFDTIAKPCNIFELFNTLGGETFNRSYISDLLFRFTKITIDPAYWLRAQAMHIDSPDAVISLDDKRGKQTWRCLINFYSGQLQSGTAEQIKFYTFLTCESPQTGESFTRTMRMFLLTKKELQRLAKADEEDRAGGSRTIEIAVDSPEDERRLSTLKAIARKFAAGEYQKKIDYRIIRARRRVEEVDMDSES